MTEETSKNFIFSGDVAGMDDKHIVDFLNSLNKAAESVLKNAVKQRDAESSLTLTHAYITFAAFTHAKIVNMICNNENSTADTMEQNSPEKGN